MITNYNEYIVNYKKQYKNAISDTENKFREDIENLFSEYFEKITITRKEHNIYNLSRYDNNDIFLVDKDYGFFILIVYNDYEESVRAELYTIYKDVLNMTNSWSRRSGNKHTDFDTKKSKLNLEEFVKWYSEKLIKQNAIRVSNREARQIAKAEKKYNL